MRGRCTAAADFDACCNHTACGGAIAELCVTFVSCTTRDLCTAAELGAGWSCAIRGDVGVLNADCDCTICGPAVGLVTVFCCTVPCRGTAAELDADLGCTASVCCISPLADGTRPSEELDCVWRAPIVNVIHASLPQAGGTRTLGHACLGRLRTRTRCPSGVLTPASCFCGCSCSVV